MKKFVRAHNGVALGLVAALLLVLGMMGWRLVASSDAGWSKHAISKSVHYIRIPVKQSKVVYCATDVLNYTNAGVFVSTDGGKKFANVTGTLPERVVKGLAVHPSNTNSAFVALLNGGVYRTSNRGKTWVQMNNGLTVRQTTAILMNELAPSTLLLGIKGGKVYRSTNGAATWTNVATVTGDVTALAADPKNKTVYYLGTSKRIVYKSTDSGTTWQQRIIGLTGAANNIITAIVVDPITTTNVYLGMSANGVFASTDGGESWAQRKTGLKNLKINDLVLYRKIPSIIYAATKGSGVFKSTTSAATWVQFDKLNLTDLSVLGLALDQVTGKHLFAGGALGIYDYQLTAP
ncbi:MAG: hypothetical protein AB1714_12185 [Acidobacteriota bacterium]